MLPSLCVMALNVKAIAFTFTIIIQHFASANRFRLILLPSRVRVHSIYICHSAGGLPSLFILCPLQQLLGSSSLIPYHLFNFCWLVHDMCDSCCLSQIFVPNMFTHLHTKPRSQPRSPMIKICQLFMTFCLVIDNLCDIVLPCRALLLMPKGLEFPCRLTSMASLLQMFHISLV